MRTGTTSREFGELSAMLVGADEYSVSIFKNVAAPAGIQNVVIIDGAKAALAKMRHVGAPDILFAYFLRDGQRILAVLPVRPATGNRFPIPSCRLSR